MPLTQLTVTIEAPVNQGNQGLATKLQAFLATAAASAGIIIQDVDWYRPESTYSADIQRLRISYLQASAPAVGLVYTAVLYTGGAGNPSAQAQFNAFFGAGLAIVPLFVIDVSDHNRVRLDEDAILVLGPSTTTPGLLGDDQAAWIGQPAAPILAGATGAVTLFDATGASLGSVTVRNLGAVTWVAGERNYVIMDEVSGEFIGLPSCNGATAPGTVVVTTTTAYPCPAIVVQPIPNTQTLAP